MDVISTVFVAFLVLVIILIGFWLGKKYGEVMANRKWEGEVQDIRDDAVTRSRAVLSGQFTEQIAPYLPDFPYSPTEVRFIGKPVDFIVFKGMDEKAISEVVFVEVKTGKSSLNAQEKNLKKTIEKGKVKWEEYRGE